MDPLPDRIPPQDVTAERHVLGLAIATTEPYQPAGTHFAALRKMVTAADFYVPAHAVLWQALETMAEAGQPIELQAVAAELRATGQIGAIGQGDGTPDDGAAYLMALWEGYSFNTAQLEYYAGVVRGYAERRRIILSAQQLVNDAFDPMADTESILAQARAIAGYSSSRGLPRYGCAGAFLATPMQMADPIVEGLLRRGETATLVSASKARKSWTALELLVDVATGGSWFGLKCRPGKGLLIDCELQPATLQHRLGALLHAKGFGPQDIADRMKVTAWRGQTVTLAGLTSYLASIQPGEFDLIVADPIYKLYPKDFNENDNAQMAGLFGSFQALAERAGAALLLVCHSPKGDTSARTAIDMVAGAGSAGRAVDVAVALRPHEASEEQHPVMVRETVARSFPPLAPECFRWEHPRWIEAPDLDPAALARPGQRRAKKAEEAPEAPKDRWDYRRLVNDLIGPEPRWRDEILAEFATQSGKNMRFGEGLLREAEGNKIIFRWKLDLDKRVHYATRIQP